MLGEKKDLGVSCTLIEIEGVHLIWGPLNTGLTV